MLIDLHTVDKPMLLYSDNLWAYFILSDTPRYIIWMTSTQWWTYDGHLMDGAEDALQDRLQSVFKDKNGLQGM